MTSNSTNCSQESSFADDFWGVLIRHTSAPSMLKNFNLPTVGYRIGPTITIPWRDLWSVELAPDPIRSLS